MALAATCANNTCGGVHVVSAFRLRDQYARTNACTAACPPMRALSARATTDFIGLQVIRRGRLVNGAAHPSLPAADSDREL